MHALGGPDLGARELSRPDPGGVHHAGGPHGEGAVREAVPDLDAPDPPVLHEDARGLGVVQGHRAPPAEVPGLLEDFDHEPGVVHVGVVVEAGEDHALGAHAGLALVQLGRREDPVAGDAVAGEGVGEEVVEAERGLHAARAVLAAEVGAVVEAQGPNQVGQGRQEPVPLRRGLAHQLPLLLGQVPHASVHQL